MTYSPKIKCYTAYNIKDSMPYFVEYLDLEGQKKLQILDANTYVIYL